MPESLGLGKTGRCSPQDGTNNPIIPTAGAHRGPTMCQAQPAHPQCQWLVTRVMEGLRISFEAPPPECAGLGRGGTISAGSQPSQLTQTQWRGTSSRVSPIPHLK